MPDAASLVGQIVDELEPGTFVTKFVLVAEVIGAEGEHSVWIETNDATPWDSMGLLHYALKYEAKKAALEDEDV